jgi:hypothetical protein
MAGTSKTKKARAAFGVSVIFTMDEIQSADPITGFQWSIRIGDGHLSQTSGGFSRTRSDPSVFHRLPLVQVREGPCQSFIPSGDPEMAVRQLRI